MKTRDIPGPLLHKFTAAPYIFHLLRGTADVYANKLHNIYGPIVQVSPKRVSVNDFAGMRDIFAATRRLDRPEALPFFHKYGAENLVSTVDGDLHQDRRRPLRNIYAARVAESTELGDVIKDATCGMLQLARERTEANSTGTVKIRPLLQLALYEIMSHVAYGAKNRLNLVRDAEQRKAMQKDINFQERRQISIAAGVMFVLPGLTIWLRKQGLAPKWLDGRFHLDLYSDRIGRKALEEIQSSISDQVEGNESLMHRLYAYFQANGPSAAVPSLEYILSDSLDNFWAGVSTTSDTLTPLFRHLSLPKNLHRQEKLRTEIRQAAVEAETLPSELPAEKLKQLPYLNAVIKETLRLHPPIPFGMERRVTDREGSVTVHGYNIPSGWKLTSQTMYMQRKEEVFGDAESWLPERWLESDDKQTIRTGIKEMKASFFAFGSGPRMCLGINVAWSSMRSIVAGTYGCVSTELADTPNSSRKKSKTKKKPKKEIGLVEQWMQDKDEEVWLRIHEPYNGDTKALR